MAKNRPGCIVMAKNRPGRPRRAARARLCRRRLYVPGTGGAAELVQLSAREIYIKAPSFIPVGIEMGTMLNFSSRPCLNQAIYHGDRLPGYIVPEKAGDTNRNYSRAILLGNILKDRLRRQKMT